MAGKRGVKLSPENEKRILAALVLHGGNISKVARELKFSKSTVHGVARKAADASNPPPAPERPELQTMDQDEVRKAAYTTAGAIVYSKGEILRNIQGALRVQPNVMARKGVDGKLEDEMAIAQADSVGPWVRMLRDLEVAYGIEIQNARLLNDQPTSIFDTVKELIQLPDDVTTDDLVTVVKASIHGRKALAPASPAGGPMPPPPPPTPQRAVIYQQT